MLHRKEEGIVYRHTITKDTVAFTLRHAAAAAAVILCYHKLLPLLAVLLMEPDISAAWSLSSAAFIHNRVFRQDRVDEMGPTTDMQPQ